MTIPTRYRKTSEPSIVSYDWIDIADGMGTISFYLCATGTSSGNDYILTQNALPTAGLGYEGGNNYEEFDFDTSSFNLPKIIEGTAYICIYGRAHNGDTTNWQVKLQKVDVDDNETDITSLATSSSTGDVSRYINVPLEVPLTNIKRGEKLRLYVKTGGSSYRTYFNPTEPNPSVIYIPFKIDI